MPRASDRVRDRLHSRLNPGGAAVRAHESLLAKPEPWDSSNLFTGVLLPSSSLKSIPSRAASNFSTARRGATSQPAPTTCRRAGTARRPARRHIDLAQNTAFFGSAATPRREPRPATHTRSELPEGPELFKSSILDTVTSANADIELVSSGRMSPSHVTTRVARRRRRDVHARPADVRRSTRHTSLFSNA